MKAKLILPGFCNSYLAETIIGIYTNHNKIVRDNTEIYSFFGNFPECSWNGGRVLFKDQKSDLKYMRKIKKYYKRKGIVIALTFTNSELDETDLNDKYCNLILKTFYNTSTSILVSSPILEKYIRKNYPKYNLNLSITATKNFDYDLNGYKLSVLKKDRNNDFDFLQSIPIEKREYLEILCNETCVNDCKYTYTHYKEISLINLNKIDENILKCHGKCRHSIPSYKALKMQRENSKYYISPESIQKKYIPMKFQYFKICGREPYSTYGVHSVVNYCIKEEYQNDVFCYIIEQMMFEIEFNILKRLRIFEDYSAEIRNRVNKYI